MQTVWHALDWDYFSLHLELACNSASLAVLWDVLADKMEGTPGEKLAATFMLLVSFSRFQIDSSLKEDLEKEFPDSGTQRAFGVWSAFMTAKKIASWQGKACLNP